jgi:hypothetical protein
MRTLPLKLDRVVYTPKADVAACSFEAPPSYASWRSLLSHTNLSMMTNGGNQTMNRLLLILNSLASAGVIIGLVFVFLQLQQAEELAERDRRTAFFASDAALSIAVLGEDFADTLVRVQLAPNTLTDADLLRYDLWANSILNTYNSVPELFNQVNVCENFDTSTGRDYITWVTSRWPEHPNRGAILEMLNSCETQTFLQFMKQKDG